MQRANFEPLVKPRKECGLPGVSTPKTVLTRAVCIGSVLNQRFALIELLGEGGMGNVYKAIDLRREEVHDASPYVAIKLLNEDVKNMDGSMMALQREAMVAQTLKHNGIASVYDFNRDESHAYIVMELIEGYTLDEFIITHYPDGIPAPQSYQFISKLIDALMCAHKQGVIHADIKPSNIKILPNGDVKLMDFGLARVVSLMSVTAETTDNHVGPQWLRSAITPSYATIARINGRQPVKVDDVYALSCVIYLMLTGQHPYRRMSADKAFKLDVTPQKPASLTKHQWRWLQQAMDPNIEKESGVIEGLRHCFLHKNYALQKFKNRALIGALALLIGGALLPALNWFNNDLPILKIQKAGELGALELLDEYLLDRSSARNKSLKEIYLPFLFQQLSEHWDDEHSIYSKTLHERYSKANLLQHDLTLVKRLLLALPNSHQLSLYRTKLDQIRSNTLSELLSHYDSALTSYLQKHETITEQTFQLLAEDVDLLKSLEGPVLMIQADPRLLFAFQKEIKKEWGARRYLPLVERLLIAKRLFPDNSDFKGVLAYVNVKLSPGFSRAVEHEKKRLQIDAALNAVAKPPVIYSPVYDETLKNIYLASAKNLDLNPFHRDLFENTKQRYLVLGGGEVNWVKITQQAALQYGRVLAKSGKINEAYAVIDKMMASVLQ